MKGRAGEERKAGGKALRVMLLALSVFFAALAAPDAAPAARLTLHEPSAAAGGNNGAVTASTAAAPVETKAYYLKGYSGSVDVVVRAFMSSSSVVGTYDLTLSGDLGWSVSPDNFYYGIPSSGQDFSVTLTRANAASFTSPETIEISASNGVESASCDITVTPVEIDPKLDRTLVTFYRGVSGDKTVRIADSASTTTAFELSGPKLTVLAGTISLGTPGPIWSGDASVSADVRLTDVVVTAGNPAVIRPKAALTLKADGVVVPGDKIDGTTPASAAGTEALMAWGFDVEVIDPYVSADVTSRTFKVGEAVTSADAYDFAVSAAPSPGAVITGIAVSSDAAGANSQSFGGGLTASLNTAKNRVEFSGTPTTAGPWNFWIAGQTTGTSVDLTSAKLTVTVVSRDVASLSVSRPSLPYTVGVAVSADAALTVTGSPQPSSLTIKKKGAGGSGDTSTAWNGLSFDVSSADRVSVRGTPVFAGSQAFTLTGTSAAGTASADFTVTVIEASGPVSFGAPVIYDESGDRVERLIPGALMRIAFNSGAYISDVYVRVARPDDMPDDILSQLAAKTGNDGYVVSHPTTGTTDVTVYYRPARDGDYTFKVYYAYGGETSSFETVVNADSPGGGGSGGCDAGFGALALFAIGGGFLRALRRGNRRAG